MNYGYRDTFRTDVFVVDDPTIYVPHHIQMVCDAIQRSFKGKEFSILVKGTWKKDGFYLTHDYIIPKQKVSAGSVDYEPLASYVEKGYNSVIHSHHDLGCDNFSMTDLDYINSFFPVSILYSRGNFTTANINFHIDGGFARYKAKVKNFLDSDVNVNGIENIVDKSAITYENIVNKFTSIVFNPKVVKEKMKIDPPENLKPL